MITDPENLTGVCIGSIRRATSHNNDFKDQHFFIAARTENSRSYCS